MSQYNDIKVSIPILGMVIECVGLVRPSVNAEPLGVDELGNISSFADEAILETIGGTLLDEIKDETFIFPAGVYKMSSLPMEKIGEIVAHED